MGIAPHESGSMPFMRAWWSLPGMITPNIFRSIPFDLRDMNHIKFDHDDKESMRAAKDQLKDHLRAFSKMGWVSANDPIFRAAYAPPEDARIHETGSVISERWLRKVGTQLEEVSPDRIHHRMSQR